MNSILTTHNLCKNFSKKQVLNNINITINKGQIYGLVGKNGAGKTTLMKIVSGFLNESSGDYSLFELPSKAALLNQKYKDLGVLMESPKLIGNMSGFENMKLKAMCLNCYDEQEIKNILSNVGLDPELKKKTKSYSLGMKQRLGIALALLGRPKFLILDEPINGLDPQGIIDIRNLLLNYVKAVDGTILISSHILEELTKVADVIGILDEGNLIIEQTIEDIHKSCEQNLEIITMQKDNAISVLNKNNISSTLGNKENSILISSEYDPADINDMLFKENIKVSGISYCGMSFEEYFLSKIGGNV